ncbi:hypothetical protein [Streptomyces griseoruber]|uniref:hypothetical protein n=1 Tax=Streptomyces griseoruber TaxID=1943 RepID=UPI000A57807C|nr:hypothetical protein [Streptomyces griseoruber]
MPARRVTAPHQDPVARATDPTAGSSTEPPTGSSSAAPAAPVAADDDTGRGGR